MKIEARVIEFGSPEYRDEVSLRDRVLREPLGLELSDEELARESVAVHVGAFCDGRLVGCLFMVRAEEGRVRMRQVAVDTRFQGLGVGRALVEFAERRAKEDKFTDMVLTARETALPFYRALGYSALGEAFVEIGIPHQKMVKRLV